MQYDKKNTKKTQIQTQMYLGTVKRTQWKKRNPENCKNCSSKCAYDYAQLQYIIHQDAMSHNLTQVTLTTKNLQHGRSCTDCNSFTAGHQWHLCQQATVHLFCSVSPSGRGIFTFLVMRKLSRSCLITCSRNSRCDFQKYFEQLSAYARVVQTFLVKTKAPCFNFGALCYLIII